MNEFYPSNYCKNLTITQKRSKYLSRLRPILRFVSKPTVNSKMYNTLSSIAQRSSGRN